MKSIRTAFVPAMVALLACGGTTRNDESAAPSPDAPSPEAPPSEPPSPDVPVPDAPNADWTTGVTRVDARGEASQGIATLVAVRTARHDTFDRIVLEFGATDRIPGYRIEYIDRPVRQCGSGNAVPLAGDGWLSIALDPANAHTEQGSPTVTERERAPGLPNVKELKLTCDFEARVEWVAGVASPEPYRAFTLGSPARLVVDVQH